MKLFDQTVHAPIKEPASPHLVSRIVKNMMRFVDTMIMKRGGPVG